MAYAFKTDDEWVEIDQPRDVPNPTAATDGSTARIGPAQAESLPAETRAALGLVEIVEPAAAAYGLRVIGSTLSGDDVPTRAWVTEAIPIEELKSVLKAAAQVEYDTRRQEPVGYDFGAVAALDDFGESAGEAGQQTLQMRAEYPHDDQKNWQAAALAATLAVVVGQGGAPRPLKTTANVWVQTTSAQALQALVTGDGQQASVLAVSEQKLAYFGLLKAQIDATDTAEALAAIDVTAGWPT